MGRKSKLIDNDIPVVNGYLHLTDNLLVPSFVLPIVQRHCDNNTIIVTVSPLRKHFVVDKLPTAYCMTTCYNVVELNRGVTSLRFTNLLTGSNNLTTI